RGTWLPGPDRGQSRVDRTRDASRPYLQRVGSARRRVHPTGRVGGLTTVGTGGGRIDVGFRGTTGDSGRTAVTRRADCDGVARHVADLDRADRRRTPASARSHPRTGRRIRVADSPVGPRRVTTAGVDLGCCAWSGTVRRRLCALEQAGDRFARPA